MANTPNLQMPYLSFNQKGKEATHNQALNFLDAAAQLTVLDRDLATPPATPATGARYLVAALPNGAWQGKAGQIAFYFGGWQFLVPSKGWECWVADEEIGLRYTGTAWIKVKTNPRTGWAASAGTKKRGSYNSDTASGTDTAQVLAALLDDLLAAGIIST